MNDHIAVYCCIEAAIAYNTYMNTGVRCIEGRVGEGEGRLPLVISRLDVWAAVDLDVIS